MKHGQNSLELVVLLGFAVLIFLSFFVVIQGKIREQNMIQQQELYLQIADQVETEILTAAKVNNGYMRLFEMVMTLEGEPYTVTLEDKNTLAIRGEYSQNEYLRFLGVNVTTVPDPSGNYTIIPRPPARSSRYALILQKNASGLYIRNDCDTVEACI